MVRDPLTTGTVLAGKAQWKSTAAIVGCCAFPYCSRSTVIGLSSGLTGDYYFNPLREAAAFLAKRIGLSMDSKCTNMIRGFSNNQ